MLLSLNNVTFEFGARKILDNASWHIYLNERIGLIGPNGTGKSTLLKILIGEYSVSSGQVNRSKTLSIGYFHQDLQSLDTSDSIQTVAMVAFEKAIAIGDQIRQLEIELEKHEDEKKLHKLADLHHDFEIAGGYEMEYKAAEVLEGLGFMTKDLTRSFNEFSGGWRMRVLLAKMILQNPDILLLDEPTNHLDLPSIEWIERYLSNYPGTVIIVSHDRYFLDRMVDKIVEISQQTLNHYSGDYSYYEQEKEIRSEMQQREYENQQDFINQQERFIDRFKAKASKAKQAQSLVKKLDRLERIEAPIVETAKLRIRFEVGRTPGKTLTTFEDVSKRYGDIIILDHASAEVNRGDKIALIGANGKGKSTVLRLLSTTEKADSGIVTPGHNADISFYAQHQLEALSMDNDIIDELKLCGSGKTEQELRELLGCFLFRGDDIYKKIRILSGGEKARVALAKTILGKGNYLLLDEPTNHLDLSSVNMLIAALKVYDGTYVVVSHDRYFIQNTANKIWEIENGNIKQFDGTYAEWEEYKKRKEKEAQANKSKGIVTEPAKEKIVEAKVEVPIAKVENKEQPKNNTSEFKEKQKEEKRLRNKFAKLEEDIAALNIEKKKCEDLLADPEIYSNKSQFQTTENNYKSVVLKIELLKPEYEALFEQLMEFES
ncbi:MAG TPA: ABC-F family ATP-binding cassette domain-containing protein [Chitinophagaceae bacterium]|nr:ABC-F family ATP-binding cassette domain-containing protein [Chitinophagaceae bacterium]